MLTSSAARERLLEGIDLSAFATPRNPNVDRAPALRTQNSRGINSDNAVKARTGIELYERVIYQPRE